MRFGNPTKVDVAGSLEEENNRDGMMGMRLIGRIGDGDRGRGDSVKLGLLLLLLLLLTMVRGDIMGQ